MQLSVLAV